MTSGLPEKTRFKGVVDCRTETAGPLGLTLIGCTVERPRERVCMAFTCEPPAGLPQVLEDVEVERVDGDRFRITAAGGEWTVSASAVHVQRDVAAAFYRSVKPRPAPLRKRIFWWLVLALAKRRSGLALLRALRRRG